METQPRSVGDYLNQAEFVVPAYQRPYQWTTDLLEGLWSDLGELYTGSNRKQHYIGVLLSVQEAAPAVAIRGSSSRQWGRHNWSLVDGQQRLVTILLLLAAIRDAGSEDVAQKAKALMTVERGARPRLLAQEEDRELFERIMLNAACELTKDESKTAVGNAYSFFRRQLQAGRESFWSPAPVTQSTPAAATGAGAIKFQQLLKVVTERLDVTDMMLGPEDQSAPAVFDAINGKRRELEPVDLLRNTVFAELNDIQLFTATWASMEAECRKVKLGGARLGTLPLFIDSYLHSLGEGASQYRLARKLNELIIEHAPMSLGARDRRAKVRHVVQEILKSFDDFKIAQSSAFDGFNGAGNSKREEKVVRTFDNISMLSSGPPLPLSLLFLRYRREGILTEAQLDRASRVLEAYLGRRVVAGEKQQLLRSHLGTVTTRLISDFGNGSPISEKVGTKPGRELPSRLLGYLNTANMPMPSDPVMEDAVRNRTDMYKLSARQKFAVLRRLNDEVAGRHIGRIYLAHRERTEPNYSIEHVFPDSFKDRASLTAEWKEQLRDWGQASRDVDELIALRNNLGNLSLVHQNSALGRRPFLNHGRKLGKRTILKDRAPDIGNSVVYTQSSSGIDVERVHWTADDVRGRAAFLAEKMKAAYPTTP